MSQVVEFIKAPTETCFPASQLNVCEVGVVVAVEHKSENVLIGEPVIKGTNDLWDPLESTCRHASLSIL